MVTTQVADHREKTVKERKSRKKNALKRVNPTV